MGNTKNIAFWIILFLLMVALFNVFSNGSRTSMGREISYSDFLNRVEAGQVASVRLDGERVYVTISRKRMIQKAMFVVLPTSDVS